MNPATMPCSGVLLSIAFILMLTKMATSQSTLPDSQLQVLRDVISLCSNKTQFSVCSDGVACSCSPLRGCNVVSIVLHGDADSATQARELPPSLADLSELRTLKLTACGIKCVAWHNSRPSCPLRQVLTFGVALI